MLLKKDKVQTILDNAPAGADKKKILDGLIMRGYDIEGVDSNAIRASLQKTTQETQPAVEEKQNYIERVGESFKRGGERIQEQVEKVSETVEAGKPLQAGLETARAGLRTAGTVAGQAFAPIIEAPGVKQVAETVMKGALKIPGVEKLTEKIAGLATKYPEISKDLEDVFNLATLGTGAIAEKPIKQTARNVVSKAGKTVDDLAKEVSQFSTDNIPGVKFAKDLAQDVIPTSAALRDRTLARSLRLAPVEDIARIEQKTGNSLGEFMNKFNLVKDTPDETVKAIVDFKNKNYNRVRDVISLVDDKYSFNDIPEMQSAIDFLAKDLQGRKSAPYKNALNKLQDIQKKGEFDLLDVQYVKDLFDDVESVYTRTGAVRDAIEAADKAQTITPIRRFIEDRVKESYPTIDIKGLNNATQTSKEIMDAIIKRSAKADTASFFQLGDLAVLGVGNMQTPGLGYAALFGKKIIESSPVQLRLSRLFSKLADNKAIKKGEIKKGLSPKQIKEMDDLINSELEKSIGLNQTDRVKSLNKIKQTLQE